MTTTVTIRGQTVIPAVIRKRYNIKPHTHLEWIDDGGTISVLPVPKDPIKHLRGIFKGAKLVETLLKSRREDRERERG